MHSDEDILWAVVEAGDEDLTPPPPGELLKGAKIFMASFEAKVAVVRSRLDANQRVVFHGATNGLNNFLYLAGLADRSDISVYDGDASKTGRFLPTCPQPILAAGDESYRRADVVYISAMTYFDPIARFLMQHHGLSAAHIEGLFP